MGLLLWLSCKESTYNVGDLGSIPGLGRSPGEGNGYPLQYSGMENSIDYIVLGVAKSWTRLSNFHFTRFSMRCWRGTLKQAHMEEESFYGKRAKTLTLKKIREQTRINIIIIITIMAMIIVTITITMTIMAIIMIIIIDRKSVV